MSRKAFLGNVFSLSALAGAAEAQPSGFFVDTSLSRTYATGSLAVSERGAPALSLGVSDLGVGNPSFQPRLRYLADRYRIEVGYDRSSFTRTYEGASLQAARTGLTPTTSLLSVNTSFESFSAGFRFDVLRSPTFSAGAGLDLDFLSVRNEVFTYEVGPVPTSSLFGQASRTSPVATLGANLHDRANRFFLDLKAGYAADGSDVLKGRAEAGYSFARYTGIKVGWEGLRYREPNGGRLDLRLSSVSGGFFFRF